MKTKTMTEDKTKKKRKNRRQTKSSTTHVQQTDPAITVDEQAMKNCVAQ